MRKINRRRANNGLGRLKRDLQLGYVARKHAIGMSRASSIWHDGDLTEDVLHWEALGQNTGTGGKCKSLFRAFWNSAGHRDNILDNWTYMGVGVKWENGWAYVQQVFERRSNPDNRWHFP